METKTLAFRVIQAEDISTDLLKEIGRMHLDYVRYSRDTTFTVPQVFDIIQAVVTRPNLPFQFWVLLDTEKIVGFALTEATMGAKGLELHIAQAFIAPGYRIPETQRLTVERFEEFARSKGCVFLTSCTRRDPIGAYIRWMGRVGFKKRWIMMEKDLRGA
jgi:hypothetical protein